MIRASRPTTPGMVLQAEYFRQKCIARLGSVSHQRLEFCFCWGSPRMVMVVDGKVQADISPNVVLV